MYLINVGKFKVMIGVMVIVWALFAVCAFGALERYIIGKEIIPFQIKIKQSKMVQNGWKIWLKEGQDGYKNSVMKKITVFGNEIQSKSIYESEVIKQPINAYLIKGTSKSSNPVTVPQESYAHYTYDMVATAYDPSPESNSLEWAGITALGWHTRYGIAAVDPKVIALRSLIFVEGYGFAWAGDTGGDIKGKRIDLCYNTTKEALSWGRRKTKVYVLSGKSWDFFRDKQKQEIKK